MYDGIRLHVARSYTSSADSPFYLIPSLTPSIHLLLGPSLFLLPCPFISIDLLHTRCSSASTSFPGLSLRFPPLSLSPFSSSNYDLARNTDVDLCSCILIRDFLTRRTYFFQAYTVPSNISKLPALEPYYMTSLDQ